MAENTLNFCLSQQIAPELLRGNMSLRWIRAALGGAVDRAPGRWTGRYALLVDMAFDDASAHSISPVRSEERPATSDEATFLPSALIEPNHAATDLAAHIPAMSVFGFFIHVQA